ncbi:MAG TPA: alpha/beta fold hydrolase [Candidatus Limnocylindrales bacterium]|nr:alpha/beta fold hydrolase [Candidatus Limnocylindrales bacterium]
MVVARPSRHPRTDPGQQVRFAASDDGVRIAWSAHGSGPPLVVVSCWLSHLQHDWQSPVWRHFLDDLGAISTLVRYDERGFGMSDWAVADFSLEPRLRDLEAVIESAGLERFALLGMSGGSVVALAYAARNPDRVTRLALYGSGSGRLRTFDPEALPEEETYRSMIRVGWAKEDPIFRRVFTSIYIPDADEPQMQWFDALQRMSTSPENAVSARIARQQTDVWDELPKIEAPTLILHAVGERATPFTAAVAAASRISNARMVPLESRNHILLADEPAWPVFMAEMTAFLEPDRRTLADSGEPGVESLSPRELDVIRAAAKGLANAEIAASLGLSIRTVERHLSNAYGKLGTSGKAARAGAVAEVIRRGLA